jgi:hypothetical protein
MASQFQLVQSAIRQTSHQIDQLVDAMREKAAVGRQNGGLVCGRSQRPYYHCGQCF